VLNFFKSKPKDVEPDLPPVRHRLYAIGDVHGRADLLEALFARIDADLADDPCSAYAIIGIGDYVDRGPQSREVLDQLIGCLRTRKTVLLKGNHESYFLEFLRNPAVLDDWRKYGGLQTLISYGLKPSLSPDETEQRELAEQLANMMPWEHRALLEALPSSFTFGNYFFTHAGIRPGIPLTQQQEQDLLWIREDFLLCEDDYGKVVVHGHSPVREPDIRSNRINIDTGAYATGRLTCIRIEGHSVVIL
jgi:serine/threonine protein phosphatase 1